jgi:hypothetical protein
MRTYRLDIPAIKLDLDHPEKFGNVAAKMLVDDRRKLATHLIELIGIDAGTMAEWLAEANGYLDELENPGEPAPGNGEQKGSGDDDPPSTGITLSAVVQSSAQAVDQILGEPDLCRASEPGAEPLAEWVSSQLRTTDKNWVLDTDPLTIHMSATGLAWRKRTFDDYDGKFHTHFLTVNEVIVNANAKSVERMPRITHDFERYPYEIDRSISRGHWVDYEPTYDEKDPQAPKSFYECDLWIDLDGDELDEPWTVTISRDDIPQVVKIKARWSSKTITNTKEALFFKPVIQYYPYKMLPDPKGGFLPKGFGWLLHKVQHSADKLLAAISDTAQSTSEDGGILAGGGFGLPDKLELQRNRVNVINTDGAPLADRYSAFPTKDVSTGSVAVLDKVLTLGDRLAGTLNLMESAPASMTATMAKGIIDTGTKVQSAVHRRVVSMMTQEFQQFVAMADAYEQLPDGVTADAIDDIAVTADPQLATEMHRSALAGIYMELMKDAQTNGREVRMRLYRTLRLPKPEALIGQPPAPQATPYEQIQGAIAHAKAKTERIKVIAGVAVQITQALKQLVEASQGAVDIRVALLQMAQLEHVVKGLIDDAQSADGGLDDLAGAAGNPSAPPALPPPAGSGGAPVPSGPPNGPTPTGAGDGLPPA